MAQLQSLVGELRSYKLHDMAKGKRGIHTHTHTHTHIHTLSLSLSQTHTHTHSQRKKRNTHTHSLSLSLSLPDWQAPSHGVLELAHSGL